MYPAETRLLYDPRDETEAVFAWRLHELLDAGYRLPHAELIAVRTDIDLHRACAVAKAVRAKGHPAELAADIFL